jgi:Flp pilus assembly protein TadD
VAFSLASLRNAVRLLEQVDRDRQVFGANNHGWTFDAPMTSAELTELEQRVGPLPDEYRALVLEIGASGAGPYYGLLSPDAEDAEEPSQPGHILLAEQGCGGFSVLMLEGPHRGEVWADWTREDGELVPEAPTLFAWYERWLDQALIEWTQNAAPRIALDGPDDPAELEAIALAFDLISPRAPGNSSLLRTLGYLHVRERRFEDARATFDQAAALPRTSDDAEIGDAPAPLRHRDLARMFLTMEAFDEAVKEAERGLAIEKMWHSTRDELRDALERALSGAGRHDEALAVLEARAAESFFTFDLHHRLARERIARGDLAGAGAALERAARFAHILGGETTLEERLAASFEPIIAELHGARRAHEGALLEALVEKIRTAN